MRFTNKYSPKVTIPVMLVIITMQLYVIAGLVTAIGVSNKEYEKFLVEHQCARTGFAGKSAVPVYQCDSGLWLQWEITSKVSVLFVKPF